MKKAAATESVFYSVASVRRLVDRIMDDYKRHYSFPETQEGFSPQESHLRDVVVDVLHEELNRLPSFMEWDAKNGLYGKCCCVAGLPDPECPQHGMHSKQAEVFYHEAVIERIKKADRELTAALHNECIATGLISAAQWNTGIAPWLARLTSAIEPYRETLKQPQQEIEAARLNAYAEADNGDRPERSNSSLRQAQGTNPAGAAAYEHLFRQFCALRDRETAVRTANNALRAALQHALDSEQEGYTDEDEPSWITEVRAVLNETETAL